MRLYKVIFLFIASLFFSHSLFAVSHHSVPDFNRHKSVNSKIKTKKLKRMRPIANSPIRKKRAAKKTYKAKKAPYHVPYTKNKIKNYAKQKAYHSNNANRKCLAQTVYFEARGESYKGAVAVGNVVVNRVRSRHFPNSICGVMRERNKRMCQFSFMCNGHINKKVKPAPWARAVKIADQILSGKAPKYARGALFFHAKYLKMRVARHRYTAKIGQHYFYK